MVIEQDAYWAVGECIVRKEGKPDFMGVAISLSSNAISLDYGSAKQMAALILLTAEKIEKEFEREEAARKTKEAAHG